MIDCIVRTIDGTYIDLSRVVAITPVEKIPSDFGREYGFKVMFLPEGIPFKQDRTFSVTIKKNFKVPREIHENVVQKHPYQLTDKGLEMLEAFKDQCFLEMDASRESLANQWREYRKQI